MADKAKLSLRLAFMRLCVVIIWCLINQGHGYICPPDNCENIPPCPTPKCENGMLLENVAQCGCCSVCVKYLEENEICNPLSNGIPYSMCGPGLACDLRKIVCTPQKTVCIQERVYYDELASNSSVILVGVRRPDCDISGHYNPKECIPGTVCYCVDKHGNRIFGTELEEFAEDMDCGCSRFYHDHEREIENSQGGIWKQETEMFFPSNLRCLANGNFDSFQCLPDGTCFCFIDGKIKSKILPYDFKEALWCNNLDPHDANERYYRTCETKLNATKLLMKQYRDNDIELVGIDLPNCDLDGTYAPVQCKNDRCFCVDKNGEKLGEYGAVRYSADAQAMHCNCARDEDVLKPNGVVDVSCDAIGSYKPIQCRGSQCFCVDKNGKQTSETVHVTEQDTLNCENRSYQDLIELDIVY